MNKKIESLVIILSIIISGCETISGTSEEFQNIEIKQNIGGLLICNGIYSSDIHSYEFNVWYKYKSVENVIYEIGNGKYEGEQWKKNEQLVLFNNLILLHTSNSRNSDKVIIGDLKTNTWRDYIISPAVIEKSEKWIGQKINSDPDNYKSVSKIQKIDSNGQFSVLYKYARKNQILPFMTGKRLIIYKINSTSGKPEIESINPL